MREQDAVERRALLLHFGDVVESIGCVMKCAARYNTIGEAAAQEEALAGFPLLSLVDGELTPYEYAARAAGAFFLWSKELLEPELNRRLLAYTIQHDLFAGNQPGWDAYVSMIGGQVPWFGADLGLVPDPDAEQSGIWPPANGAEPATVQ
jgi:hypothetical protein